MEVFPQRINGGSDFEDYSDWMWTLGFADYVVS